MRWTGHVAHMKGMRNAYKILVAKLEGNRLFGRTVLKLNVTEILCGGVNWFYLTCDRIHWQLLVNVVMNLQVP
jgi:hypothetical protein